MEERKQLSRMLAMEYCRQNNFLKNEGDSKTIEDITKSYLLLERDFYDALAKNNILLVRKANP